MSVPYAPSGTAGNVGRTAYSGFQFNDPYSQPFASQNPDRIDMQFFGDPTQNNILGLWQAGGGIAGYQYSNKAFSCLAGLNVGQPCRISGADSVVLALATSAADAAVIGFVAEKPTPTTCLLSHFQRVAAAGLNPGALLYLTDTGAAAMIPGTYPMVIGVAESATSAMLGGFPVQAISGYSGYSGYSGAVGASGQSGTSGKSGASGASGTSGVSGWSGYSGYSGAFSGISGYSGWSGYSGTATGAATKVTVAKTADQSRTSGTAIADDSELIIALEAGKTYVIQYQLQATVPTAQVGGIKVGHGYTGTQSRFLIGGSKTTAQNTFDNTTSHTTGTMYSGPDAYHYATVAQTHIYYATAGSGETNPQILVIRGMGCITTTTGGNLSITWTSNDYQSVTVKAGSVLMADQGTGAESGTSGRSGWSGYSGRSGWSSYSGVSGYSGYSGYSGAFSGISGYSGLSGLSGFSGTWSGWSGASGASGYSGLDGVTGWSGVSGYSSVSGASGTSGWSAYSGYSGYSGDSTSGYSGYSGISGTSGISGQSGFQGAQGAAGDSGRSGYSAYSGKSGVQGDSGFSGFSGTGSSGTSGLAGDSGRSGRSGWSGHSGGLGPSGQSGASGQAGSSGTSGIEGTSGSSGKSGLSGTSGFSGVGISGSSGVSASSGASGFSGLQGQSGASGWSALSGTSGWSGESGFSGTFSGTSGFSGELGPAGTSGQSGYSGAIGTDTIQYVLDGGEYPLSNGIKGTVCMDYAFEVLDWRLVCDQAGDLEVDVWRSTYAGFPPNSTNSICGTGVPTITGAQKGQDSVLAGWTKTFAAGTNFTFYVVGCAAITRATLAMKVRRT